MLGLQLPRIKDLGPIIVVWIASMGVLIMQHDLGTSLMFFAMFVAMLYTATGRKSWIIIGLIAFAAGAVLAAGMFSHVGQRVDAWLHPFSNEQYNKTPGGSWQLVTGIFGLASGGHARHRSRPRPSFARYVCELRFHLRLSGRGTRSDGRPWPF